MANLDSYKLNNDGLNQNRLNHEDAPEERPRLWQSNPEGDPDYPWYSRKGENGEIIYSVPLEAPNDIPPDSCDEAEGRMYSWLPLFGGKGMRVYWAETASREWAFSQKRWLDAEAKRDERRREVETPVDVFPEEEPFFFGPSAFPQPDEQAMARLELAMLRDVISKKNPRWWKAFCLKELCGLDVSEIAAALDIAPSRVYQLIDAVKKLARKYREENP